MPDVVTAVATLLGTALGAVVTYLSARTARDSAERVAREQRRSDERRARREEAAEAFALAVEAVQWLHPHNVEDSVDPEFAPAYEPLYLDSVRKLREARHSLNRLAALGSDDALTRAALATARELAILDEAWDDARGWRRHMLREAGPGKGLRRMFDKAFDRLVAARRALTGLDVDLIRDETAVGGFAEEGSLLADLRRAIAGPA